MSSSCVQIGFLTQGRCSNNKNEYHDYRRAGGVPSLNQKSQAIVKREDELRWTRGNPNGIYGKRKEENSPELLNSGGARTSSGTFRLMQRPRLRQWRRSAAVAELGRWRHHEEEMKTRRQGGGMKRTPSPIYKAMDRWHARESRRPKNDYVAIWTPWFSGILLR